MKEKLIDPKTNPESEPIWCAAASIKKEIIFGEEHIKKVGTKHFRGGAKVYIIHAWVGTGERLIVIGRHRKGGRYI